MINYESDAEYGQYLNYMDRVFDNRMDENTDGRVVNGSCELNLFDSAGMYEDN